jgi:hypothetical protein
MPNKPGLDISELQYRFVLEALFAALAEIEQSDDISQKVEDDLRETLRILGAESDDESH